MRTKTSDSNHNTYNKRFSFLLPMFMPIVAIQIEIPYLITKRGVSGRANWRNYFGVWGGKGLLLHLQTPPHRTFVCFSPPKKKCPNTCSLTEIILLSFYFVCTLLWGKGFMAAIIGVLGRLVDKAVNTPRAGLSFLLFQIGGGWGWDGGRDVCCGRGQQDL